MSSGVGVGISASPVHSFQRATISSSAKSRSSVGDSTTTPQHLSSFTPSPQSTPTLLRSRSLRMSGRGYKGQQLSGRSSRTPEICSFNSSDLSSSSHDSSGQGHVKALEAKVAELRENCEFLEKECQVLNDSLIEMEQSRHQERTAWAQEREDLQKQIVDAIASKVRVETIQSKHDALVEDLKRQLNISQAELAQAKEKIDIVSSERNSIYEETRELKAINKELKQMITERLTLNGEVKSDSDAATASTTSSEKKDTIKGNYVLDFARLRLQLDEKEKALKDLESRYTKHRQVLEMNDKRAVQEIQQLDQMLDQAIDAIKSWPQPFRDSPHVKNLMQVLSLHEDDFTDC